MALKRALISAFIAFHLLAIVCWALPPNALLAAVRKAIAPYMFATGLFQQWDMFAPPKDVNERIEAAVVLESGQIRNWKPESTSNAERERERKFFEVAADAANASLWPDIARHIARASWRDKGNPPAYVMLVRYWRAITPDGKPQREYGHIFFEYTVRAQDLE